MSVKLQDIADLLADCIAHAPETKRNKLADAIETYAQERWRTWDKLRDNATMRMFTDAMIEGSDARPGSYQIA